MILFPKQVRNAFVKLGEDQRGIPEQCMIDIQFVNGGGVLNPIVEHVGDLTHRITHLVKYVPEDRKPTSADLGHWMVEEKVRKCLRYLRHSYGFSREMEQNIENNFEFKKEKQPNLTLEKYRDKIYTLLEKYAEAHAKLVVYNKAQWHCREAAIQVGKRNWSKVEDSLLWLKKIVNDEEKYVEEAGKFSLDKFGKIIPF